MVSVRVDDVTQESPAQGTATQGYAALMNLTNMGGVDHPASSRGSPFIKVVCTGALLSVVLLACCYTT